VNNADLKTGAVQPSFSRLAEHFNPLALYPSL